MPIPTGNIIISRNPEVTAYEIAVANGFVGTEAQWLESLIATPTYKVYSAIFTQTGGTAPTVTVLENTLGGTVVWTYVDVGVYLGTLVDAFTLNKTYAPSGISSVTDKYFYKFILSDVNNDFVQLETFNCPDPCVAANGVLTKVPIEIRVYP